MINRIRSVAKTPANILDEELCNNSQQLSAVNYCYKARHSDGGPCDIETSPLICPANQRTGFYMTETSIMNELNKCPSLVNCL